MKRIAVIKNGVVINIAVWDGVSTWNPGDEYTLIDVTDIPCGIEWIQDGGAFDPPATEDQ